MSDLNIAMILRFVDKATAPAAAALRQVDRASNGMMRLGRDQVALNSRMIAQTQARSQALLGEAAALAASGAGMVAMLRPAIQFEDAMTRVGAVSRASDEELARLTETARQLGRETPWAASQAAEGMQFLAMAGFDVNETIAAMPGLLNLASAGATDLGTTSDIASNVLTGFNMDAAEMGRLGDVLANTFTTSNTNLSMLGETMKYVAPAAASLGVDVETTAAMAGKLGDAGIQGSEAGTALRAVLLRLSAPSSAAAALMQELGIQTTDAAGNMRALPEILADLDKSTKTMGSATRAEVIKTIFETEAMSAATVLLGSAGSGALQEYAESLRETGTAARIASKMNDTVGGSLRSLSSRAEAAAISIGNGFIPVLANMVERIMPVIDQVTAWAEANPQLVETIGWVIVGLFGLRAALLLTQMAVQTVMLAYWAFNAVLGIIIWVMGAATKAALIFGKVLRLLAVGVRFVGRALIWMGRAALANPIGLLIAAIAAGAYLIYRNWDGIVDYFSAAFDRIKAAFDEGFLQGVVQVLKELNPLIFQNWDSIVAYFTEKFDRIKAAFGEGFLQGMIQLLKEMNPFTLLMDLLRGITQAVFDEGAAFIDNLHAGISSRIGAMVDSVRAKINSMIPEPLMKAWSWVLGDGETPDPAPTGGRELGGPVRAGQVYRWLEKGEEYFVPNSDGKVVSNRDVRAMRAGGGSRSFSIGSIHVHAAPGMSARDVAREVARQIEEKARAAGFALDDGGEYA
ncbi:phage tail tape measure protein [Celeribacter sp.]|uniref:phage tail tape measure protein n=1 Tax=Celeribacter sp. TaxID=1890673 RepID=UPI003A8E5559